MDLSSVSLFLGAFGTIVAVGNQVVQWIERRRRGTVDERRLDIEGLRTLTVEQREELDDARDQRQVDRRRIEGLEDKVDSLTRDLRKAHDDIDRLTVLLELKR